MTVRSILGSRRSWRQSWRVARWAALAPALAALWACNSRSLEAPKVLPTSVYQNRFQETINRDIDIVFVIDNSSSMLPMQTALLANFPRFMGVLQNLPDGLPNVRIAVISSDMGAGAGIMNCGGFGNNGVFQYSPKDPCTDSTLGTATHIVNENGTANYTNPDIGAVFSCIANLGTGGCGLEQHLLSLSRALGADGFDPPAENQNFLRPDAYLGIIFIANEDDCSATAGANSELFTNIDPNTLANPFGPVGSFRCNEFGHVCEGGVNPSRTGTIGQMMAYQDCAVWEASPYLRSVNQFVDDVKGVKVDPDNQILVASIVGVPRGNPNGPIPYNVTWAMAPNSTEAWPAVAPGCGMVGTLFGDPPLRLKAFTQGFGDNGLLYSICEQEYGPAMAEIAERLSQLIGPKCIIGTLADKDPDMAGDQQDCTVIDHVPGASGAPSIDTPLPSCAAGAPPPCWVLQAGNATNGCGANSFVMTVMRDPGQPPPSNLSSTVSCSLCVPNVNAGVADCSDRLQVLDPRCPCP